MKLPNDDASSVWWRRWRWGRCPVAIIRFEKPAVTEARLHQERSKNHC